MALPSCCLLATPAVASAATPLATAPRDCGASFDPYAYTASALAACPGIKTFALNTVSPLPGGGKSYEYNVDGVPYTYFVPPAGFDPLTATDAQLREYAIPPRPTNPALLSEWQLAVMKAQLVTLPPFLAEVNVSAGNLQYSNWSGYVGLASTPSFTSTGGEWVEPSYGGTGCSGTAAVLWSGIGGAAGTPNQIGQAGTAYGNTGINNHQAWSEVVPDQNSIVAQPLTMPSGDSITADVAWTGSTYQFNLYNDTTGQSVPGFNAGRAADYSGVSVEDVVERPRLVSNGQLTPLANFQTANFSKNTFNNGQFLDTYSNLDSITMYNGSSELAHAGSIGSLGNFYDYHDNCH